MWPRVSRAMRHIGDELPNVLRFDYEVERELKKKKANFQKNVLQVEAAPLSHQKSALKEERAKRARGLRRDRGRGPQPKIKARFLNLGD